MYPYYRAISSAQDPVVMLDDRELVMLGSNNYLGLTNHPEVKEAAAEALARLRHRLRRLAAAQRHARPPRRARGAARRFTRREAALTFSTGFQVNLGVLSCLLGRRDVAILDALDHACIIDGCRLGFGRSVKFRHNDMADLEQKLADSPMDPGS